MCVKLIERRNKDHKKENEWVKIKKFEPYILMFQKP